MIIMMTIRSAVSVLKSECPKDVTRTQNNNDLNRPEVLPPGQQVNTSYINSTKDMCLLRAQDLCEQGDGSGLTFSIPFFLRP